MKEKQTFAVPGLKKEKDALSKAYTDFTMAMLAIADRRYEKARSYLTKAIERDPESIYLNRTMALVLKKLKDLSCLPRNVLHWIKRTSGTTFCSRISTRLPGKMTLP
ncbi:MAG: tetratricopeptide repeat protein [Deltaproteobacteria bacterium]|nr:tetratricopeptide repeat protein [Deltaproteobacteria bacterium]